MQSTVRILGHGWEGLVHTKEGMGSLGPRQSAVGTPQYPCSQEPGGELERRCGSVGQWLALINNVCLEEEDLHTALNAEKGKWEGSPS